MNKISKYVLITSILFSPFMGVSSTTFKSYETLISAQKKQVDELAVLLQQKEPNLEKIEWMIGNNPSLIRLKNQHGLDPLTFLVDRLYDEDADFNLKRVLIFLSDKSTDDTKRMALLRLLSKPNNDRSITAATSFVSLSKYNPYLISVTREQKGTVFERRLQNLQEAFPELSQEIKLRVLSNLSYAGLSEIQKREVDQLTFLVEESEPNVQEILKLVYPSPFLVDFKNQKGLDALTIATDRLYGHTDNNALRTTTLYLASKASDQTKRSVLLRILNNPRGLIDFAEYFVRMSQYNPHLVTLGALEKGSLLEANLKKLQEAVPDLNPSKKTIPGAYETLSETQKEAVDQLTALILSKDTESQEIVKLVDANPSIMTWKNERELDPLNTAVDRLWYEYSPNIKDILYELGSRADSESKNEALYWILDRTLPELGLEGAVLVSHACHINPETIMRSEYKTNTLVATNLRRLQEAYIYVEKVNQLNDLMKEKAPDINAIQKFVEQDPSIVNFKNERGINPLNFALYQSIHNYSLAIRKILKYLTTKASAVAKYDTLIKALNNTKGSSKIDRLILSFVKDARLNLSTISLKEGWSPIFAPNLKRLQETLRVGKSKGGTRSPLQKKKTVPMTAKTAPAKGYIKCDPNDPKCVFVR